MPESIGALIQAAVAAGEIAGAVAVTVRPGEDPAVTAGGWQDAGHTRPMGADTVFRIASMTKPITTVAALQLVERRVLSLHDPVDAVLPALRESPVLDGYDAAGAPILRPARRPVTLHHLLTHTSGLAYTTWNRKLFEYRQRCPEARPIDGPDVRTSAPLMFDPGDDWAYSTATDWVGFAIESATGRGLEDVLRSGVLEPLGMHDTGFDPPERAERLAEPTRRRADGALATLEPRWLPPRVFASGGGGLFASAPDYGVFMRALLDPAAAPGLLAAGTWEDLARNQVGDLVAGEQPSLEPERSNPIAFFAGTRAKWGLGFLINPRPVAGGRAAGSLTWGGLFNSYFWIDRDSGVAAALFTQMLPFCDVAVLSLFERFERAVYADRRPR